MKSKMRADQLRQKQPDEVLEHLATALAERGDLLPTDSASVAREEAELDASLELPERLRAFEPRSAARSAEPERSRSKAVRGAASLRPLAPRWLEYAAAAGVGALAATAFFSLMAPHDPGSSGPLASREPPPKSSAAVPPTPRIDLTTSACGNGCCAGASCAAASHEQRECPSGRTCIQCGTPSGAERFRLKLGSMALSSEGAQARDANGWSELELCMRVGSSDFSCAPAHRNGDVDRTWSALPLVASIQDGLAGFELEVRALSPSNPQGARTPVAKWRGPVAINPTVLCKGLVLKPKHGDVPFGTVSLFLDDTHYVELARGESLRALTESLSHFTGTERPHIFQRASTQPAFALSVGPLSQRAAERLRWSVLEQGGTDARVVLGLDYLDDSRP